MSLSHYYYYWQSRATKRFVYHGVFPLFQDVQVQRRRNFSQVFWTLYPQTWCMRSQTQPQQAGMSFCYFCRMRKWLTGCLLSDYTTWWCHVINEPVSQIMWETFPIMLQQRSKQRLLMLITCLRFIWLNWLYIVSIWRVYRDVIREETNHWWENEWRKQEGIRNAKHGGVVTGSPALYYKAPITWLEMA